MPTAIVLYQETDWWVKNRWRTWSVNRWRYCKKFDPSMDGNMVMKLWSWRSPAVPLK